MVYYYILKIRIFENICMQMVTLLLSDQSCEILSGNEPEDCQGYCTSL